MSLSTHRCRRSLVRVPTLVLVGVLGVGSSLMAQSKSGGAADLEATKAALDKYRDPVVAVREGYFSTLGCIDFPKGGAGEGEMEYKPGGMGVHFLNPALIGPTLDPLKPQVLIYEPVGGRLELVAAEWFVPTAVSKEAPSIFGKTFDGPMEGHAPILPTGLHHWDLHVWLWKANPNGMMHPTNSNVRCPDGPYTFHEEATKKVHLHQ